MAPAKLNVEVEVGPRFEVFYALHKLFAPATPVTDRWRKAGRARLGHRLESDARDVAPDPLMWAVLADSVLHAPRVTAFEDLVSAMESQSEHTFRETILAGVPDVPGVEMRAEFESLLGNAGEYRTRVIGVLRAFWSRVFAEDFKAIEPELDRMARQMRRTVANAPAENVGTRLGIPLTVNGESSTLTAGRNGYEVPLDRVGRVLIAPSAFNLNRWWTKRETDAVDLFFPLSDGTITPNGAATAPTRTATPAAADIDPETVFRALGDTTRYAIASILARTPATPTELSRQLKVSKPTITHHVHSLRDAGLIVEGAQGGKLALDRSRLENLSAAAVSALFASDRRLKLSKTRKK